MNNKYDKSDLASFSVNDSSIEIIIEGPKKNIRKAIRLNDSIKKEIKFVYEYTLNYVEQLNNAGINLPRIIESNHTDEEIIFICEYVGENITDYVHPDRFEDTLRNKQIFQFIFDCLEKAQTADINFDPHPKNYVINEGIMTYVDFTPPFHQDFYDLRAFNCSSEEEKRVIEEFFRCFHPDEIGYHLAGDLIKMHNNIYPLLPLLYEALLRRDIIAIGYNDFLARAETIKNRELAREEKNIYLL